MDAHAARRTIPLTVVSDTARAETFGYVCNRCMNCCRSNDIQIDPYEAARIARGLGLTTSEFRGRFTARGEGTVLKHKRDGACVFLNKTGCAIHPDRPLVCRLYPLGREVTPDGEERFTHLKPHPRTAGSYTRDGTIGEFLAAQDAAPFMQAADRYYDWFRKAYESLQEGAAATNDLAESPGDLLDMDIAVHAYCSANGIPEPDDLEERTRIHLTYLYEQLEPQKEKDIEQSQTA